MPGFAETRALDRVAEGVPGRDGDRREARAASRRDQFWAYTPGRWCALMGTASPGIGEALARGGNKLPGIEVRSVGRLTFKSPEVDVWYDSVWGIGVERL